MHDDYLRERESAKWAYRDMHWQQQQQQLQQSNNPFNDDDDTVSDAIESVVHFIGGLFS